MPKRTGPTDPNVIELIHKLKKKSSEAKVGLWRRVAEKLETPRRMRAKTNLSKINRHTKENDVVIVPGSVLSAGNLNHSITVAALRFSNTAKEKILTAKGKHLSIEELLEEEQDVSKIKIIV